MALTALELFMILLEFEIQLLRKQTLNVFYVLDYIDDIKNSLEL